MPMPSLAHQSWGSSVARWKPNRLVSLVTLLSAPLFLYGLGDTYLWQDEAQTALLGRSVLQHGVPMVGHGSESLSSHLGTDEGIGGLYLQIAWLQAYLAAGSFTLFGESSWSARAPFALSGWLCVPLIAWAMRRAGSGIWAARIAAILTALSVTFIVPSRQARYYSLAAAVTLLVVGAYAKLARRIRQEAAVQRPGMGSNKPRETASSTGITEPCGFGIAVGLLVLSFDLTAAGVLGALGLHWLLVGGSRKDGVARWDRRFLVPWGVACLLLVGWLALSFTAPSRQAVGSVLGRVPQSLFYYLGQVNAHMIPLPLLLTLASLRRRESEVSGAGGFEDDRWAAGLFATIALGGIAGATLAPSRFFRYAVPVLPVILGLSALGFVSLARYGRAGRVVAGFLVLVLVTSNVPLTLSHGLMTSLARASGMITVRHSDHDYRVPLSQLLHELRDPPLGPIAETVGFLREHAYPGEVLVTTYGDLPLKFHANLEVYGGETGQLPDQNPTWVWPRHLNAMWDAVQVSVEWLDSHVSLIDYERIELPAIDRRFENQEDPDSHVFSNPGPPGPRVVLYFKSQTPAQ